MMDRTALAAAYRAERPKYERLAKLLEQMLKYRVRQAGIKCTVDSRAKEVGSFVKKVVREGAAGRQAEFSDLAGARIVLANRKDRKPAESLVNSIIARPRRKGPEDRMESHELGYLGVNITGYLRTALDADDNGDLAHLRCEVQIHTRAQNLWSDMSHALLYKPVVPPPDWVQRLLYKTAALVEFFDEAIERAAREIYNLRGYQEAGMVGVLDKAYFRYADRDYDAALSLAAMGSLKLAYTAQERARFDALIEEFTDQFDLKLRYIFAQYAEDDRCSPFLFQPESLLMFERLEHAPFLLEESWPDVLPPDVLDDMRNMWGTRLGGDGEQ